jgi:membrane protein DedA with SNARE-associated domain
MLVAGAVAAGVVGSAHHVSVFGAKIGFGGGAYVVLALAGTLGYLAGALVGWWIGLHGGRPLLEQRGRWLHVTPENLDRAERWFERWGNVGVLVGRITPIVRSFVSIPAGIFEMPFAPYAVLTLVGSAIWAFAFAGAGYGLGSSYERFHHDFRYVEYAVVAGVVLGAAYLVYRWTTAARVNRRAADPPR